MAKKLFTMERTATVYMQIEVAAETAEEAEELAKARFENIPLMNYTLQDERIRNYGSVEFELDDYMIDKAKESIHEEVYDVYGDAVHFEPVEVHYDLLECDDSGHIAEMVEHTVTVDSAYLDEDDNLWIQDEYEEHEDFELDNFDDVDQAKIIKAILSRK